MRSIQHGMIAPALMAALVTALAAPAFADGDAANGEKAFRKCAACHTITEDGPSRVGPNLYDIVGRTTGAVDGFAFSAPMTELGEEGHVWTPEELDRFIEDPKAVVPGTKMAFAGIKKPEERADLVAYLLSVSPGAEAGAD
ncbi:c-type cytochrome [Paracoccus siganidrum]|nr:cytochrome c family protein [Paracoccus siganidrum]